MSSPTRKSNHTPSILFNEEAEKTANFLPIIDQRSQNTTPRNSTQLTPSGGISSSNANQSVHAVFKINQRNHKRSNSQYDTSYLNGQQRKNQQSYQQDVLDGLQQRSKDSTNSRDMMLYNDSTQMINSTSLNRRSIQLSSSNDHQGQNLYNSQYGYQVNLERDLKLNHSYEVEINTQMRSRNSHNNSLLSTHNQSKHRSQSCKRKPSDQLLLGSIDFSNYNQIYAFTPQSAPHGHVEGSFVTRKSINQVKTLGHPPPLPPPHQNFISNDQQIKGKAEPQISLTKIKESTTPNPLQNPFDPLRQETQIHFETDGCRKKLQEDSQNDIRKDNRFPIGFFVQTPSSSKRRTIRLNQNIYNTPLEKREQQIQSFSNINEYQFTFGDEETELQDKSQQFDFYHNIQSSKNANMYSSQQYGQGGNSNTTDAQLVDKPEVLTTNERHTDFLNQQITKNDVCRQVVAKGGLSLSANQQRPDEKAVIEQVTFGLFPMKDHNARNSSCSNQKQTPIHIPLNDSPVQITSAGVRKYAKPKSLLFKKMFEKMSSLIEDQKKADNICQLQQQQSNHTTSNSPIHGSERVISNSVSKQENCNTKAFRSRQSSPKNKQYRPSHGKKHGLPISVEQVQDADEEIKQINQSITNDNLDSPYISGYTFSSPNSLENSKKDNLDLQENQVLLNFQKKLSSQQSSSQQCSSTEESDKVLQLTNQNSQKNKSSKNNQKSTEQSSFEESIPSSNGKNNNDKLNKWLQEHNQFKQTNLADYQRYNGISCHSVVPSVQQQIPASIVNKNNEIDLLNNNGNTFVDKTRLYNNIQTHKVQQPQTQPATINQLSDLYSKGLSIQPATFILTKPKKEQKQVKQLILQSNIKLQSASELDMQYSQQTQSSKGSPKSVKKRAVVRKIGSVLLPDTVGPLGDENESSRQTKQNKYPQHEQKIILQKISQEEIQIKDSPSKSSSSSNNNSNYDAGVQNSQLFSDYTTTKRIPKEKKKNTPRENNQKVIGPWISEKDYEEDCVMEKILQNQTPLKI